MKLTDQQINEVMGFKLKMQYNNIDISHVVYMLGGNPYVEGIKPTIYGEVSGITVGFIVGYND